MDDEYGTTALELKSTGSRSELYSYLFTKKNEWIPRPLHPGVIRGTYTIHDKYTPCMTPSEKMNLEIRFSKAPIIILRTRLSY